LSRYAVACRTDWFWDLWSPADGDRCLEIRRRNDLSVAVLEAHDPEWVFFPHWSHIVPEAIWGRFRCVVFHAAPLPYGRGGSPVQNLISRGHTETDLCALQMTGELDAGPVYLRERVSLLGGGDEVFLRLNRAAARLVRRILDEDPVPVAQTGEIEVFRRRRPADGALPMGGDLSGLFDHIRMLDAEGYPPAFVDVGPYRLHFSRPARRRGAVQADVRITLREPEGG
jgi:methionyl-tRNA formyltransferase